MQKTLFEKTESDLKREKLADIAKKEKQEHQKVRWEMYLKYKLKNNQ